MFMEMVEGLSCSALGYTPYETIKGFPYDWRQSLRSPTLLLALHNKIVSYANESPTKTIDVISHSMGGLLLKSLFARFPEDISLVNNWIAVGTPWGGSSDTIISLINGVSIGELSARTEHLLALQYPSFYELLALTNANLPDVFYNESGMMHQVTQDSLGSFLHNVNSQFCVSGTWTVYCQQFSLDLWDYAQSILNDLKEADKVIKKQICEGGFNFFSIQGSQLDTAHDIWYNTSVQSMTQLIEQDAIYHNVSGDGTVPLREALAEPLSTKYLYLGSDDHRHIIRDSALISDIVTLLRERYDFEIIQPANSQPDNFCVSPTPTPSEDPVAQTEPSAGSQPNHLLVMVLIAVSVFVVVIIIAVVVIRLKAKRRQYNQII